MKQNIDWEALEEAVVDIPFDALPTNIREWTDFRTIYEKCVEVMNDPNWDPSTPECVKGNSDDFDNWRKENSCFGMNYKRSPFELFKDLSSHFSRESKDEKEKLKSIVESYISSEPIIYVNSIFDLIRSGATINADYTFGLNLKSTKNLPKYVRGDISWNPPTLEGCPRMVGGEFKIISNKSNVFTQKDLIGSPEYVGGDYIGVSIDITSVEGISKKIGGRLTLTGNEITDVTPLLDVEIGNAIHVSMNKLTHLPALKTKQGNIFVESNPIKTFEIPECGILWISSVHEDCDAVEAEIKHNGLDYISVERPFGKVFKVFVALDKDGKKSGHLLKTAVA